jgi:hypothetical protein
LGSATIFALLRVLVQVYDTGDDSNNHDFQEFAGIATSAA